MIRLLDKPLNRICVAAVIFVMAIYAFIRVIASPFKKNLGIGVLDLLSLFIAHMNEGSNSLEGLFENTPNEEICEHTWDNGVEVESGVGAYLMEYTCTVCGKKNQQIITIIPPLPVSKDDIVDKVYVYEKDG